MEDKDQLGNDEQGQKIMWFTTTLSTHMEGKGGASMFPGLYECTLDIQTGKCTEPEKVVDVFNPPNEHHRGLDIMNVKINDAKTHLYAGYYEGHHNSFEILKASLDSPPVVLESFFRTSTEVNNAICMMQCCESEEHHHTYYQVELRDYTLHDGEVFISWDGFYQNCADDFASKIGLKWTIGVSKVIQSPECVNTGGDHEVLFHECTVPVAIPYHDTSATARKKVLGYSGFQASRTPSGNRMFWLSALDREQRHDGLKVLQSELFAMAEGGNHYKNPNALQGFGRLRVAYNFVDEPVDDVASIRLKKNNDGIPDGLCRTAYDAGVACYSLSIDGDDKITMESESLFVTSEQIKESCTIPPNKHYPITERLPPVSTGLEVVWDPTTGGDSPQMLFFGCYGEISGHGNITTVFRNGTAVQTLPGAYSGSILFGPDEAVKEEDIPCFPPELPPAANNNSNPFLRMGLMIPLFVGLLAGILVKGKIAARRLRSISRYDRIEPNEDDEIQFGTVPMTPQSTTYVELRSRPAEADIRLV